MRRGFYNLLSCLAFGLAFLALPVSPGPARPPGLHEEDGFLRRGGCQAEAGGECRCPPRPRETWLVGLAHFYDDVGNIMANGEVFTDEGMTIAIRQDLLADWPLGNEARLTSACGSLLVTVADVMPFCEAQPEVVVDVSPAVCELLFCGGCGYNGQGVAYGEELVMLELLDRTRKEDEFHHVYREE